MSTPNPEGHYRIGDTERLSAIESLTRHFTEGRLDRDEFDERTSAVHSARTREDLAPLFADLPGHGAQDPVVSAAAEASDRSAAAPATRPDDAPERPDEQPERSRFAATVMAVIPLIALVLFFVLGEFVGYDKSWIVWFLVPIAGVIARGAGGELGGRDRRRERRGRRRGRRELD